MFDKLFEKCIDERNTYKEGGFILSSGKVIELPDYVMGDHDDYAYSQLKAKGVKSLPGTRAYDTYLKRGNIRYLINLSRSEFDIEFGVKPTETQVKVIYNLSKPYDTFYFASTIPHKRHLQGETWQEFVDIVRKELSECESLMEYF